MTSSWIDEMYQIKDRIADFAHVAPVRGGRKLAQLRLAMPPEPIPDPRAKEGPRTRALRAQLNLRHYFVAACGGSRTVKPLPAPRPIREKLLNLATLQLPPETFPEPKPLASIPKSKILNDARKTVEELEKCLKHARERLEAMS